MYITIYWSIYHHRFFRIKLCKSLIHVSNGFKYISNKTNIHNNKNRTYNSITSIYIFVIYNLISFIYFFLNISI